MDNDPYVTSHPQSSVSIYGAVLAVFQLMELTQEPAKSKRSFRPTSTVYIGTAGWTLPTHLKDQFPFVGTHLQKYAQVFNSVEINSSFYKEHKFETYVKWASSVPENFRFSVKLSRYFTQETRLEDSGEKLKEVLQTISGLGKKFGCLLVQLPPSLDFELKTASRFIDNLRKLYQGALVWEPRHLSWATPQALQLLIQNQIQKVWADPEPCPVPENLSGKWKAGLQSFAYFRLHGSPVIYKSRYTISQLAKIKDLVHGAEATHSQTWCIFDNTTYGFATENARELMQGTDSFLEIIEPARRR
ncbi:MAG: DUF72 domain-containing protein [Pseudobdellovibrionaceae bacterium]